MAQQISWPPVLATPPQQVLDIRQKTSERLKYPGSSRITEAPEIYHVDDKSALCKIFSHLDKTWATSMKLSELCPYPWTMQRVAVSFDLWAGVNLL